MPVWREGSLAVSEIHGHGGEMDADDMIALLESRHLHGDEQKAYLQIRRACEEFGTDCARAMDRARDKIGRTGLNTGGASPELRAYIVDMIKRGLEDVLALDILDRVYLQNGLYDECLDICDDILRFDGYARDIMVGSTLVECSVHRLVSLLPTEQASQQKRVKLAARCTRVLEGRARMLGMDMFEHGEESDPLYRADLIAMDIYSRRHFEAPGEIARLFQGYPRLCEFLGHDPDKMLSRAQKKTYLAYYASVAINVRRSTPFHGIPRAGPLDELESLLEAMERRGLDSRDGRYGAWRSGICGMELLQRSLEMRLYLHFLAVDDNPELEPHIDNGKRADLRVGDLYIEAFAPHEASRTAFGHMLRKSGPGDMVDKLGKKSQIDSFGHRHSMIIMEDPHDYARDGWFLERLTRMISRHAQLGGVLVAMDAKSHYTCRLVRNPSAGREITPGMERMVMRALETPYMP